MNLGTIVLGLLNGLTIGLLAVGFVLVYKSNRFLNLAHAQLGTLSALLLAKWVLDWGWSWWIAFVLAVVIGLATGLIVERFLIAPLRRRTRSQVRLLLMSVGISQLLLSLTFVPALGPDTTTGKTFPQPFVADVHIGGVALTGMNILTAVLVPVLVVGLALFMRYSMLGKQIRAAANNPDAARLCGIPVGRVSAITWGLAGTLSAVSAVLQAPTQPSFNIATLGPYLLMLTLGAAAFGAFVSLPLALAGGVVLGLVAQIISAETANSANAEVAVFAVILLVVLVRGRAISGAFATQGAAVEERPPVRIPPALRSSGLVRHPWTWLGAAAGVLGLVLPHVPYFSTEGNRFLLSQVLMYALLALALTMLVGWGGQVSMGHFAVVGLGAYLTGRWAPEGWSLMSLFVVVGLVGAGVLVLVGLPALRVRGLTLAVTTMGFAVISANWLFRQDWAGSSDPFVDIEPPALGPGLGTPRSMLAIYYLTFAILVLGVAVASALRRSAPGRLFIAVRDNERAASSFGTSPATIKLALLAVSGFYAGVAGVLYAEAWQVASPTQFTPDFSVALLALPVIGGMGSLAGAIAAACAIYLPTFFLGPHLSAVFGELGNSLGFQLFLAGTAQVAVLLSYPSGMAGLTQDRWQRFLNKRAQAVSAETIAPGPTEVTEIAMAAANAAQPPATNGEAASGQNRHAEPSDEPPLETAGVRVRFGGVVALDGPDITVRHGEIVGLIGPNGAGKTTLMNVISGVQRPDEGSVHIFGNEVVDLPPDFRAPFGMARSFQDASLFAGLTVTQTLQIALSRRYRVGVLSSMSAAPWVAASEVRCRRDAQQVAERFGLTPWADSLTSELSTGTRRICDLAAQVAAEPRLLLLDEPTAGVAQREAEAFGPLLRRIRDELDCAILIVEHDMPLLMGLCDRVYAMEAGRIIAEGTPEEIRNDPLVIASYLGNQEVAISRSGTTGASMSVAVTAR